MCGSSASAGNRKQYEIETERVIPTASIVGSSRIRAAILSSGRCRASFSEKSFRGKYSGPFRLDVYTRMALGYNIRVALPCTFYRLGPFILNELFVLVPYK